MRSRFREMKRMKRMLHIAFGMALLVIGFFIFQGYHLVNRNRFEVARQATCLSNLREIGNVLQERGLLLVDKNKDQITAVLHELQLKCPSGLLVNDDKEQAGYFLIEGDAGQLIITESPRNHDPNHIPSTSVPATRFYLRNDWSVQAIADNGGNRNRAEK
jgi:hypothetical protein